MVNQSQQYEIDVRSHYTTDNCTHQSHSIGNDEVELVVTRYNKFNFISNSQSESRFMRTCRRKCLKIVLKHTRQHRCMKDCHRAYNQTHSGLQYTNKTVTISWNLKHVQGSQQASEASPKDTCNEAMKVQKQICTASSQWDS